MGICINGCPKSGNHALLKSIELLGSYTKDINHIPFNNPLPIGTTKHILIKRDPRNVIISWLRHNRREVSDGTFMSIIKEGTIINTILSFSGWLQDKNTYVVKFEDLVSDERVIKDIANYIETPYIPGAFDKLPGLTKTWTGDGKLPNYSDYRNIWTDDLDKFWLGISGLELLTIFGY